VDRLAKRLAAVGRQWICEKNATNAQGSYIPAEQRIVEPERHETVVEKTFPGAVTDLQASDGIEAEAIALEDRRGRLADDRVEAFPRIKDGRNEFFEDKFVINHV